jgi:hypothetical protein
MRRDKYEELESKSPHATKGPSHRKGGNQKIVRPADHLALAEAIQRPTMLRAANKTV